MLKPIFDITPFTMLDYPSHTACIIWFAGCNMRCGYCYNPEIVRGKGHISIDQALAFLQSRTQLLQAVVLSGGECTTHPGSLIVAQEAKKMGYQIKIDTNGSRPDRLQQLLDLQLVDYLALDFKAPEEKHEAMTRSLTWELFLQSFQMIKQYDVPFEVRTTWHSELLSMSDLQRMLRFLEQQGYTGDYFIQRFKNGVPTLDTTLSCSAQQLDVSRLSSSTIKVVLRG